MTVYVSARRPELEVRNLEIGIGLKVEQNYLKLIETQRKYFSQKTSKEYNMSKRNLHIDEEVRKTMEMGDHIQKVEGNPFLLTRVMQQLENEKVSQIGFFSNMAPVYKLAFSVFIIALNVFVYFQLDDLSINTLTSKSEIDFVDEYGLVYEDTDELTAILEK